MNKSTEILLSMQGNIYKLVDGAGGCAFNDSDCKVCVEYTAIGKFCTQSRKLRGIGAHQHWELIE